MSKKKYTYDYPMPCVACDIILFGYDVDSRELNVLLIERKEEPFMAHWALPGGHINMKETLEQTALRELEEETGTPSEAVHLEQLYTFGDPGRDPRGRYVSVAYMALVDLSTFPKAMAGSDAKAIGWFPIIQNRLSPSSLEIGALPELAFDHLQIIDTALERLQGKIVYQPVAFNLLPNRFTLTMLQDAYECILCKSLDKRNFRKKVLGLGILKPCGRQKGSHRPATLYSFDSKKFWKKKNNGFFFEF